MSIYVPPDVPVPGQPVAVVDSFVVNEDTQFTGSVVDGTLSYNGQSDSDPDGDSLTVTLLTPPVNGDLTLNADGTFTFNPNANFAGADQFEYEISDGNGNTDVAIGKNRSWLIDVLALLSLSHPMMPLFLC